MKKLMILTIAVVSLQMMACTRQVDSPNNSSATTVSGSYKVSFYWDKKDETADFAGYSFQFNTGGQVVATKSGTATTGSWSETSTKFTISFPVGSPLEDLNDDWLIEEKTSTTIKLKDDNPAQDDKLHFTKL